MTKDFDTRSKQLVFREDFPELYNESLRFQMLLLAQGVIWWNNLAGEWPGGLKVEEVARICTDPQAKDNLFSGGPSGRPRPFIVVPAVREVDNGRFEYDVHVASEFFAASPDQIKSSSETSDKLVEDQGDDQLEGFFVGLAMTVGRSFADRLASHVFKHQMKKMKKKMK
ncbi:MAG TPA: hypothetical protein VMR16_04000 [Candidatus Saccharimonadales bacterium]|nr:hypothetical protein [Candidatus Saccharimonadales bacterium]